MVLGTKLAILFLSAGVVSRPALFCLLFCTALHTQSATFSLHLTSRSLNVNNRVFGYWVRENHNIYLQKGVSRTEHLTLNVVHHTFPCIFFSWWCYSYGPQQGPDGQQKKRGGRAQAEEKARGSCSRRPRTRERKPGKRKGPKYLPLPLPLLWHSSSYFCPSFRPSPPFYCRDLSPLHTILPVCPISIPYVFPCTKSCTCLYVH